LLLRTKADARSYIGILMRTPGQWPSPVIAYTLQPYRCPHSSGYHVGVSRRIQQLIEKGIAHDRTMRNESQRQAVPGTTAEAGYRLSALRAAIAGGAGSEAQGEPGGCPPMTRSVEIVDRSLAELFELLMSAAQATQKTRDGLKMRDKDRFAEGIRILTQKFAGMDHAVHAVLMQVDPLSRQLNAAPDGKETIQ
jgi:hypothetical protein